MLLLGHDHHIKLFRELAESGRLPHAFMMAGRGGIGKGSFAQKAALWLLSLPQYRQQGLEIAENSPLHAFMAAGVVPDLLIIGERAEEDQHKDISVNAVREVEPFLRLTPSGNGWRVVIIDHANNLNRSGQNALLKIIEEPPPQTVIFLVCDKPGMMLPTIRSRCRLLEFSPLSDEHVQQVLLRHHPTLAPQQLPSIAALAHGSAGTALAIATHHGDEWLQKLLNLINNPNRKGNIAAIFALGEAVAESSAKHNIAAELLLHYLYTQAKEAALQEKIQALAFWLAIWEKINKIFADVNNLALDRRAAWQIALGHLLSNNAIKS
ncbi:MAG: hypothetical protein ACOYK8_09215 [Alphaproteobacteria bacterium]